MLVVRSSGQKHLGRWLGGYARHLARRVALPSPDGPRHVLFAVCDHFEPLWNNASPEQGRRRMARWTEGYPALARGFLDADGRPPRHTFFFPGEQYDPVVLDRLGALARAGLGEVELHLHHDGDTADALRRDIRGYVEAYAAHGHLSRDARGVPRYGFIHGNWSLANSRRDGRWCGVDSELEVLFETGCYADFTFPSAPDETQPPIVNQIYWPMGDPALARAHETGSPARVGGSMDDRILVVEGPLALALRPGRRGIRIESAALTARDPAAPERVRTWVSQGIHVLGRPEWIFVKVHTHGAPEDQADSLLGSGGRVLHEELARRYNDGERYVLHYVTAREMFNIAVAAMHGCTGDPGRFRDHVHPPPPVAS